MLSRLFRILIVAIAVNLLSHFLFIGQSICYGQGIMSPDEIINAVERTQLPSERFQVKVTQEILLPQGQQQQSPLPIVTNVAEFTPQAGLKLLKDTNSVSKDETPVPRVFVDLKSFLDKLDASSNISLNEVDLKGYPHYKLSCEDTVNSTKLSIWVDQNSFRIDRIEIDITGRLFAEINFDYTGVINGYWLPSMIHLHHFTDDSRINLGFSNYEFK